MISLFLDTLRINGWTIFFHPLFYHQWVDLVERVKGLKAKLESTQFVSVPDVKFLKALDIGIKKKIPQNPLASHLALKKPLQKYGRLEKMGLPNRYRLFFRAFKAKKVIVILWLGFPRQEGDNQDCYQVFFKKVLKGEFPYSLESFLTECQAEEELNDDEKHSVIGVKTHG